MSSKLKGSKLETEVDKCRSECNWRRLGDLLLSVRSKNSGMEQYGDLLQAEYIIESFVELNSDVLEPKTDNKSSLEKAAKLLNNTLQSSIAEKSTVYLETNLLLSKLHYYCAEYEQAMHDIENSRLEFGDTPFESLRDLRLVAEAYAIKGFCMEATMNQMKKTDLEKCRMRTLFCFEKSAELAISYVQELEKSINLSSRSGVLSSNATGANGKQHAEKMGDLLETTLEKVPLLRLRHNIVDRPWDNEGIEWYRRIMTSLGDKMVGEKLQQRLSRQLAEVLIRGVPDSGYVESQSVNTKSQYLRFYTGSNRSYFSPSSRIEEILLLLLISEVLATKDVVLNRAEELAPNRKKSLRVAKSVYNLLTLVLSALRQYELLASIYEKAMKFANEDRYLWFQFALALICHGRYVRASKILSQCLAFEQCDDNTLAQHLFAAEIAIEHFCQYDEAIKHSDKAIELCEGNWLSGRCLLLKGIAMSMKAETLVRYEERCKMQLEVINLFEQATAVDSLDDLAHYYCARQHAIARDLRAARDWCERTLELNPEMPAAIMLLALIFTAQKDYKAALELTVDALEDFPTNYPLIVLKLMLEVKFGRVDEALSSSQHLLYFWKKGDANSISVDNSFKYMCTAASDESQKDAQGSSLLRSVSSRDAVTAASFTAATSLGILSSATLANMTANKTSGTGSDMTDGGSVYTAQRISDYGNGTSTISLSSMQSRNIEARFMMQANIWLELAELFLDLDRMEDVRSCIEEASALCPSSHQSLYIKGRLLAARAMKCNDVSRCERLRTDAKASLLGALAIAPSHVSSLRHLAHIYRLEGNIPMAEKMLRDVIQIDPLHCDSWQALGMILSNDGRFEEALECFSTATALSSSTPLIPFSALPVSIRIF
ncbi:unnamed protein product [Thelazia callipaeda]|uniref:TTC7_N domain-containing protein n=1 Tax=Thelazia callipaeda TaxID=103827 RepID=A0A0N5CPI0_THECL|nr:unnamed protein product [Thelazia callipaeda]